jgi:hypothetical protein
VRWERLANLSYKIVDDHGWACGWVPADAMDRHIDTECHLRVEPCPAQCGQILFVGKMDIHLSACPRKIKPCPLECGMNMEARFLEDHAAVRQSVECVCMQSVECVCMQSVECVCMQSVECVCMQSVECVCISFVF